MLDRKIYLHKYNRKSDKIGGEALLEETVPSYALVFTYIVKLEKYSKLRYKYNFGRVVDDLIYSYKNYKRWWYENNSRKATFHVKTRQWEGGENDGEI